MAMSFNLVYIEILLIAKDIINDFVSLWALIIIN